MSHEDIIVNKDRLLDSLRSIGKVGLIMSTEISELGKITVAFDDSGVQYRLGVYASPPNNLLVGSVSCHQKERQSLGGYIHLIQGNVVWFQPKPIPDESRDIEEKLEKLKNIVASLYIDAPVDDKSQPINMADYLQIDPCNIIINK